MTKDKNRPFLVNTDIARIKVLGTTFNVKSYPEDLIAETTLETGLVDIERINTKNNTPGKITLKPNQKLVIYKDKRKEDLVISNHTSNPSAEKTVYDKKVDNKLQKMLIYKEIDTKLYTSWKDNKLVFVNEPLEDLALKLERWYNVNIEITDTSLTSKTYTGLFENETVEQVLEALSLTSNVKYSIDKNYIRIYK